MGLGRLATLYLSLLLACITIASFFSQLNNPFELLSHFVVLYIIVLSLILLMALALRARAAAVIAACALVVNVLRSAGDYVPVARASAQGDKIVKIIEFNCWGPKNRKPLAIRDIARREKADIICFCEVEGKWFNNINREFPDYPYKSVFPYNCGVAMASRLPIKCSKVLVAKFDTRPRMLTTFDLGGGRELTVLLVHPTIPLRRDRFEGRNTEFELYARDLASVPNPKLITGDLNCTPWSFYFRKLLQDTGLADSEKGFGVQCSWPTNFNQIPFLPIDHFLVSPDIFVRTRKIEPEAGSDHRPVMIEFSIDPADRKQAEQR
ncbi:MAG: endonuclease/exonuclease/phosphatase family protein [Cyanobacteria bacterium SZAS TMP-1]|nr:endonuclease/exonuclease/phosphatase family protein [Cyanobacteria bacterium SZAS TMP-1]